MLTDEQLLKGKSAGMSKYSDVPVYMLNNEQLQAIHPSVEFLFIDGHLVWERHMF